MKNMTLENEITKLDPIAAQCMAMFGGATPIESYQKILEHHAAEVHCYGAKSGQGGAVGRLAAILYSSPSQLGAVAARIGSDTYGMMSRLTGRKMSAAEFVAATEGISAAMVAKLIGRKIGTVKFYRTGRLPIPSDVAGRVMTIKNFFSAMIDDPALADE